MATIDLTPSIIASLRSNTEINTLTWWRIASPRVMLEWWKEAENPKIWLRQMWGVVGKHRYLFLVDADTTAQARDIAVKVINRFTDNALQFRDCPLIYAQVDWTIMDSENEASKKPQAMFYMLFEIPYE